MASGLTIACSSPIWSVSTSASPASGVSPRALCTFGRRRSQSTSSTRRPTDSEVTIARLIAEVVLPSPGEALVIASVFSGRCEAIASRRPRRARNCSATKESGWSNEMRRLLRSPVLSSGARFPGQKRESSDGALGARGPGTTAEVSGSHSSGAFCGAS